MLSNILNAFFCVYCRVFLQLPSINNTNLSCFSFLTQWRWRYATDSRRNRPRTANVNQYAQFMPIILHQMYIVLIIGVEGVCHIWLHYPWTSAGPFLNCYNSFQFSTNTNFIEKYEWLDVDFEETGSQSLLVIKANKKFASFNFGKDIFCRGK